MYLLDTNTCIRFLNRSNTAIYQRLINLSADDACICDVVKYELYFGAYKSSQSAKNLENLSNFFGDLASLPFDGEAAKICGQLRAMLQAAGTPIGAYDLQIAAIALTHDLTLITHNTREFSRIPELKLEDWETD